MTDSELNFYSYLESIAEFGYNIDISLLEVSEYMPTIRPSSDLRNKYNEISEFCHKYSEPVFITKNGQNDLAVMSIETFNKLVGKFELYTLLDEGMAASKANKVRPFREALVDIKNGLTEWAARDYRAD